MVVHMIKYLIVCMIIIRGGLVMALYIIKYSILYIIIMCVCVCVEVVMVVHMIKYYILCMIMMINLVICSISAETIFSSPV